MKKAKNKTNNKVKVSKDIPNFKNEDEERNFWAKNSVLDFQDRFKPTKLDFSKLKPSTEKVTLRMPKTLPTPNSLIRITS